MVALGLLILVLSGGITLAVVLSNTDPVAASAFGISMSNVTVGGLFLVGAIAGLAFMLGLVLLTTGAARRRTKRVHAKRQVRDVRTEKEQLAQENAELKARLDGQPYPNEDGVATDTEHHGLFHR